MKERKSDLNYFTRLLDLELSGNTDNLYNKWDNRAESWEKEYSDPAISKSVDRVQATVDYLMSCGLFGSDCDVADIGCGPGRFAVAFASSARHVLGIDISEKMIQYGSAYAERENINNVSFRILDFQTADIDKENLNGRFDLVFSSLTPAVNGTNGLKKMMRMSRKYCCNIMHVKNDNELECRIMREVFHRERVGPWAKQWRSFYSMFNVLFLMGYYPEVTFHKRHLNKTIRFDQERVNLFVEQMLRLEERTIENEKKIYDWARANADVDGKITEISDTWYGRILWDVREKGIQLSGEKS